MHLGLVDDRAEVVNDRARAGVHRHLAVTQLDCRQQVLLLQRLARRLLPVADEVGALLARRSHDDPHHGDHRVDLSIDHLQRSLPRLDLYEEILHALRLALSPARRLDAVLTQPVGQLVRVGESAAHHEVGGLGELGRTDLGRPVRRRAVGGRTRAGRRHGGSVARGAVKIKFGLRLLLEAKIKGRFWGDQSHLVYRFTTSRG
eukprot:5865175-Prymnesium_polylepis.1